MKLNYNFYQNPATEEVAKNLLGKFIVTHLNGHLTSGMIVETEAYCGKADKASHAYNGRRTGRTEIMYREGGTCYVYLIYGIHALFNVVTNSKDNPDAVLIRAIEPIEGIDKMLQRRKLNHFKNYFSSGPGLLSQALGITTSHTGKSLCDNEIWLEDRDIYFTKNEIISSPRVGVAYAGEDAHLLRRYRIINNAWTSRAK